MKFSNNIKFYMLPIIGRISEFFNQHLCILCCDSKSRYMPLIVIYIIMKN